MLTIFACPKPFTDLHIATIQRNAIKSWLSLRPTPEIILIGDEDGTAAICRELGLRHVPDLARTGWGTPRFDDVFMLAQREGSNDLLCYVNADIILLSDFPRAVNQVTIWRSRFLATGARWNVETGNGLSLGEPGWEHHLRDLVYTTGQFERMAPDYFVFPRGLFRRIPQMALGRTCWDNWLFWSAIRRRIPVVDMTAAVLAVHQNHLAPAGWVPLLQTSEVVENRKLVGPWVQSYNLEDSTYCLNGSLIERRLRRHWANRLRTVRDLGRAPVHRLIRRAGLRRSSLDRYLPFLTDKV